MAEIKYYAIFLFSIAGLIFFYIQEHNRLIELRIAVPRLERDISRLKAEKKKLEFELEQFFNPTRLEEISHRAQYAHLEQVKEADIHHLDDMLRNAPSYIENDKDNK